MKSIIIAGLIGLTFAQSIFAEENIELDDITVKSNRFERKDTETTYASEIHTAKQIEASGAATLYDFLAQQSSVNLGSYFGNKATPTMNLRGYGSDNGNQNIVITVDGQRLNNIDSLPQLISAIPLGNIDRIEISKGSGSVIYGDGATAGTIQIYTKSKTGVTASTSFGNYGQQNHYVNAGISEKYFDLSANVAHDSNNGYSVADKTGNKDAFTGDTQNIKFKIKPTDDFRLLVSGTNSRNDIRYANALTKSQFNDNPAQNGNLNTAYTHQGLYSQQWSLGFEYDVTSKIRLSASHYNEDKVSNFLLSNFKYDYLNKSNDLSISFNDESISAIAGIQSFDGNRDSGSDITSKDSRSEFINTEYRPLWLSDRLTLSAGYRTEKIEYHYAPTSGAALNNNNSLNAWDLGANYRFTPELSAFTNFNKAYLAPNIDSFFTFDNSGATIFNGFIKPQQSRTLNIGLNHAVPNNKLKATVFYVDLTNEIYLDKSISGVFNNTNIDESHKYGLELQDYIKISDSLNASLIYSYTRSIIDKEIRDDGSNISGKDLPSAPKHSVVANLNYKFLEHASVNLNQVWRSSAYASEDFLNNFSQRQQHYESTNVALSYQYKNMRFFTAVSNLFEYANSIQIRNDDVYAIDFSRTWRVGMKADF